MVSSPNMWVGPSHCCSSYMGKCTKTLSAFRVPDKKTGSEDGRQAAEEIEATALLGMWHLESCISLWPVVTPSLWCYCGNGFWVSVWVLSLIPHYIYNGQQNTSIVCKYEVSIDSGMVKIVFSLSWIGRYTNSEILEKNYTVSIFENEKYLLAKVLTVSKICLHNCVKNVWPIPCYLWVLDIVLQRKVNKGVKLVRFHIEH